ncbi:hypothetical protein IMG5_179620, partial [Ichthyophthirius multifiliis]
KYPHFIYFQKDEPLQVVKKQQFLMTTYLFSEYNLFFIKSRVLYSLECQKESTFCHKSIKNSYYFLVFRILKNFYLSQSLLFLPFLNLSKSIYFQALNHDDKLLIFLNKIKPLKAFLLSLRLLVPQGVLYYLNSIIKTENHGIPLLYELFGCLHS